MPVDIVIDSAKKKLAAYQVAITFDKSRVKIVGVEGGDAGFTDAPFYDRAGMDAGRIVIAAFVGDDADAKAGRTRVARLHVMFKGDARQHMPPMTIEPVAAARPGGEKIQCWPELVAVAVADRTDNAATDGADDGDGEGRAQEEDRRDAEDDGRDGPGEDGPGEDGEEGQEDEQE